MKTYNINFEEVTIGSMKTEALLLGEEGRGRMAKTILRSKVETLSPQGWLARVTTQGPYIRGAQGRVATSAPVKALAFGRGAFGDAGGLGSWDDLLLVVSEGTFLRIRPTRGDWYYLYFKEDGVEMVKKGELENFCSLIGVEKPTFKFVKTSAGWKGPSRYQFVENYDQADPSGWVECEL